MKNITKIFSNPIWTGAGLFVLFLFLISSLFPLVFFSILSWIQNVFVTYFAWFYNLLFFVAFGFCCYLAFSPYGKRRLGNRPRPKYNIYTWIAMLFSAGMGTGLLFSGVYEPLYHYVYPPIGEGGTKHALSLSFQLTFLHWGFSGWAVYTLIGLSMAYLCFYGKSRFRISDMLPFVLKKKTSTMIDILSVTVILLGVATTLGRGALQINSGLKELFGLPYSPLIQSSIVLVVTLMATASLLSGLNKGIRVLSEWNIIVCVFLLLFALLTGPTAFLLTSFVEHGSTYLKNLIKLMAFSHGTVEWRSQWTTLYWAWWLAWAPFVGLFIARISEGRTIRQFVIGALLIPTLFSCVWFVVFGGTALQYHKMGLMNLEPLLKTEYSSLVFAFFQHLPLTKLISGLALMAVVVFFVTSSDSASYVIHLMADTSTKTANKSRGFLAEDQSKKTIHKNHSRLSKLYWSTLEGLLAMALIYFGGMKSMELLVIIMASPFSILFCLIVWSFFKQLRAKGI